MDLDYCEAQNELGSKNSTEVRILGKGEHSFSVAYPGVCLRLENGDMHVLLKSGENIFCLIWPLRFVKKNFALVNLCFFN